MSTALDAELLPVARDLIAEFGTTVTLRFSLGTYSRTSGSVDLSGVTPFTGKIVPPYPAKSGWETDTTEHGFMETWIAAMGIPTPPVPGGSVDIDGVLWRVPEIRPVRSGDDICIYGLLLQRA